MIFTHTNHKCSMVAVIWRTLCKTGKTLDSSVTRAADSSICTGRQMPMPASMLRRQSDTAAVPPLRNRCLR